MNDYGITSLLLIIIGSAYLGGLLIWLYLKSKFVKLKKSTEAELARLSKSKTRSVMVNQITDLFMPFLPEFLDKYNPKDARFLGSPVDLIVFDGLEEGKLERIVFVQIESQDRECTERELMIRQVVLAKKVELDILNKKGLLFQK